MASKKLREMSKRVHSAMAGNPFASHGFSQRLRFHVVSFCRCSCLSSSAGAQQECLGVPVLWLQLHAFRLFHSKESQCYLEIVQVSCYPSSPGAFRNAW